MLIQGSYPLGGWLCEFLPYSTSYHVVLVLTTRRSLASLKGIGYIFSGGGPVKIVFASLLKGAGLVSCISCHQVVQLMMAYRWARLAILVAGKGRGQYFYFFSFFPFIPVPILPCPSHSSPISFISFLPFSGRQHKMTH